VGQNSGAQYQYLWSSFVDMIPYGRNVRAAKEIVETPFTNLDDGAERIQMPDPVSACQKANKKPLMLYDSTWLRSWPQR